jgi:uncharacterized protein YecT (DUF1311 family)
MLLPCRFAALTISLAISTAAFGQNDARPHKVLTPEQRTYQQSYRAWSENHRSLQAKAKQIYDTEMAREKAGDCPAAQSTREFEECYSKVFDTVSASLKDFESTLRALMLPPPQFPGTTATSEPGPAGPTLTSDQLSAESDQVEHLWHQYADAACTAAFHQFDGGTGGRPFEAECEIKLTRNHLREIDLIYGNDLHL